MNELPFSGALRWLRHDALRITPLRTVAVVLAVMAGLVYVPYLENPLVFDDFNVINGTDFFDYAFQFWLAPRWLPYATLAHTYALTDGYVPAMRAGNIALHALNAVAVFVLLREIFLATLDTDRPETERASRSLAAAMLGATVFAVHPVAVYGVGYLVQRTILMSTLFMLLMLIAYWRWLVAGRGKAWAWSALWYALSVFSKEHSVMAPAVALLMTLLLHRPSWALARRLALPFAIYTVIALMVVSMVKGVLGSAYEPFAREMMGDVGLEDGRLRVSYWLSVATQSFLYFKYWALWIYPNTQWMSLDLREPLATSITLWPYGGALLAFVIYMMVAACMVSRGGRIGIAGWVLAYPGLMFATEFSTIRVQEPFVLYRTYIWFPIAGVLPALAIYHLNVRITWILSLAAVIILMPLSWNRLDTMSDTLLLWEDATKLLTRGDEFGAGRIYYNRALAYAAKGQQAEAEADLDRVVKLHPRLAPVYFARARTRFELKRYAAAVLDLNEAIVLKPGRADFYYARAITLLRLGRDEAAMADLQKSCELKHVIGCYALEQRLRAGDSNNVRADSRTDTP